MDKVQVNSGEDGTTFAVCLDQDEKKFIQSVTRYDRESLFINQPTVVLCLYFHHKWFCGFVILKAWLVKTCHVVAPELVSSVRWCIQKGEMILQTKWKLTEFLTFGGKPEEMCLFDSC